MEHAQVTLSGTTAVVAQFKGYYKNFTLWVSSTATAGTSTTKAHLFGVAAGTYADLPAAADVDPTASEVVTITDLPSNALELTPATMTGTADVEVIAWGPITPRSP